MVVLPAALVGGLAAMLIDGTPVSLGSLAGFFAVFAIAIRMGVVLINRCQAVALEDDGSAPVEVVHRATRERLMPALATTVGGTAALLPFLLLGHRAGFELAHPIAVVVIGGLATSVLVNLLIVPGLFVRFGPRRSERDVVDLRAHEAETDERERIVDVATRFSGA
jgi:Cu/Ag efflux pump CusA